MRRFVPLAFVAALVLGFPLANAGFDGAAAWLRLAVARVGMEVGLVVPSDTLLLGMYRPELPYAFEGFRAIESGIGRRMDIVSIYTTWGERAEDRFPSALVCEIAAHGSVPMITWEPWTTEFASTIDRSAAARRTDLAAVADGVYDEYLREWARGAVLFGRPLFLRFAHEMNNQQYPWSTASGNDPDEFVAAWRHVWRVFREVGADNVIWVWSPKGTMPRELWPGGAYVDWIGASVFNYGDYAGSGWKSFEYLYEEIYRSALPYDRPIMISELGCVREGGNQGEWYREASRRLTVQYLETRAVIMYANPADRTSGTAIDWSIDDNETAIGALRTLARAQQMNR